MSDVSRSTLYASLDALPVSRARGRPGRVILGPRWRKVLADLWSNKTRSLLAILTIAVGVFAVGFVTSATILILGDMEADYQSSNAHSAILYCAPFDDDLLPTMRRVPGVGEVEGRNVLVARVPLGHDQKPPIYIVAISLLSDMRIDLLKDLRGRTYRQELADRQILIERSAVQVLGVKPGDALSVELPDGRVRELQVAGLAHDVNAFAYSIGGQVNAYVTPETMVWLGGARHYNQLFIRVAEKTTDQAHVTAVSQAVADKIKKSGRQVYTVLVFRPGHHLTYDITQGVMVILGVLGVLTVLLSAFLVVNTITTLLGQHVRQIGVMKAIGGGAAQIAALYFGLVFSFGVLALAIAAPLAAVAAYGASLMLSGFLNFILGPFRFPPEALALQAIIAFVVPLAAAAVPVFTSVRITVREAISTYGLGRGHFGRSWIDKLVERVRFLSRPMLIALRNTVRRKFRLALTLSTLTLGGAIFIAVFNLWTAFDVNLAEAQGYFGADVTFFFNSAHRLQKIEPLAASVPGVVGIEGWGQTSGQILSPDKKSGVEISLFAPPADSTLIQPVLTDGRWLQPGDENAIVIGNHVLKECPDLKVGDPVVIQINNRESLWRIVGIYKIVGNVTPPIVYTTYDYLAKLLDEPGLAYSLRVITSSHDLATQKRVAQEVEARFKRAGIQVGTTMIGEEWRAQQKASTDMMVYFLLMMAALIGLVGSLGLMGTMSMNVIERTREIGVMRAIGASSGSVLRMVIVEGMLVGVLSWGLAVLLSVPITYVLNAGVGVAVMTSPMNFVLGWNGIVAWLMGVLALSALASALPAWNAARLTVREVLAYE